MKPSLRNPYLVLALATVLTSTSRAQSTLLTDDFTVTGTTNTYDTNFNLSGRQSGTQATSSWTTSGNIQAGNNYGGFGQPTGDFLLVADNGGSARLDGLVLSSALVGPNERLVISFKADTVVEYGDPSNWLSFMISPSSASGLWHPVVGSGDFGMLIRGNGQVQAFNNGGVVAGINNVSLASATINTITLTFSGADGAGSPFAGNGTRVVISDGTNSWTTTLDAGFTSETISFGSIANGVRGFVDDFSITTEPSFPLGRWSGETNGTWDEATVNFSGQSFAQMKLAGVNTATFADIDGSGNPVAQNNVTIAAGGVEIPDVLFSNNSVDYTLNSADANGITGSTHLTKTGSGTLTLTGTHSYTGTTAVSNGMLALSGGSNRLPTATELTLAAPGVLRLDGNHQEVASLSGNGRVVNGNATTASFTVNTSGSATFSGNLGGTGLDEDNLALIKSGAGTLNLTAPGSFTGGTTIADGTLSLNHEPIGIANTAIGAMDAFNTVTINNGGILTSDGFRNNWLSNTAVSSGGGNAISVVVNPGGTLKGANNRITGLGNVTLAGGTIEVSDGLNAFGWFAAFNLGGDLTVSGSTPSSITTSPGAGASANFQLADGANNTSGGGTRTVTVADVTGDPAPDLLVGARLSNGTLVKEGPGTVEITAGASGTGSPINWEVNAGSFVIANAASFEFRVTNTDSNRVYEGGGNGSATFNGILDINTSAVTLTTGAIWSLIDVAGLGAGYGPNFSVAGFTGPDVNGVWTKTDSIGTWSFSQGTGELQLDAGSDYDTWVDDNGVANGQTGDDDNDGLTNFEEYAFGLDPQSGASSSPITEGLDRSARTFSYTRRDSSLTDVSYSVWFSTDLAVWTEDVNATEAASLTGEVETVEVTLSNDAGVPLPGRLFVQVRAE
jgi:autotransporter-associated beta strand protein